MFYNTVFPHISCFENLDFPILCKTTKKKTNTDNSCVCTPLDVVVNVTMQQSLMNNVPDIEVLKTFHVGADTIQRFKLVVSKMKNGETL